MNRYEQIDISGDVGLTIYGETLEELFENAAAGLSDLITDSSALEASEVKDVAISADSTEGLLVQWLNELVFLLDAFNFIGKSFTVTIENNKLAAAISGGFFDPHTHESRLLVKAATYHELSLQKSDSGWVATVIFDI